MDVEVIDPVPRAGNIQRVAAGGSEFCVTSVQHYLTAVAEGGELPARFVSIFGQRHTLGAIVPEQSPVTAPADLPGRRLGGDPENAMVRGLQAGLARLGLGPAELVPTEHPPAAAFATGRIDFVAATVDTLCRNTRQAGMPVRAIPMNLDVYMSGLVAADSVAAPMAWRVRECLVDAFERQRKDPEAGLDELLRRYPDADPDDAREGWLAVEPYIFCDGREPGSMDAARWPTAVAYAQDALRLSAPAPTTFYRSEFCS